MRRLMANDVAYGAALLLFVAAVVAWVYWPDSKPSTTTTTEPGLVLQTPPLTPLQAQRAKRSGAGRSPDSTKRSAPPPGSKTVSAPGRARNRRVPVKTLPAPRRKAARRPARQRPAQPAQPGQNPPPASQQPKPPVCVTAPAPVTVTTPVAGVNTC
jgi:hypothetical protein